MRTYDLIADLPVRIDDYALEGLEGNVSSEFKRRTTVVHLRGNGEEGHGEDVAWDSVDQERALRAGPSLPLAGDWTVCSSPPGLPESPIEPAPPAAGSRWG